MMIHTSTASAYSAAFEHGFLVVRFGQEIVAGNAVPELVHELISHDQSTHPARKAARKTGIRTAVRLAMEAR